MRYTNGSAVSVRSRALALRLLGAVAVAGVFAACRSSTAPGTTPASHPAATAIARADAAGADAAVARAATTRVRILAMNDLHGNLEPPNGSSAVVVARRDDPIVRGNALDADAGAGSTRENVRVVAGGAAYVATHLRRLRDEVPANVFVHVGDLTGATPFTSAALHDEPPIVVMNRLGLRYNAVGNHEFDHGLAELLRFQSGGCAADEPCDGGARFPGASFEYLAANVRRDGDGTVFPPYDIATVGGARIAFIGMTLRETPTVSTPKNMAGLSFESETRTVNALVPELRAKGANAIVVLVHQGATPPPDSPYDACGIDGEAHPDPLVGLVAALDPAVDVVLTAHTHRAYVCDLGGKIVTSAASYGRIVTAVDLTFDAAHALVGKTARNVVVTRDVPKDPEIDALVTKWVDAASPIADRIVGHVDADLVARSAVPAETSLGDVIADAMLAATRPASVGSARIAFMNPGGMRADVRVAPTRSEPPGAVTYGEIFAAQPFGNVLVTETLTGAEIARVLEEQFQPGHDPRLLQPSRGFAYAYDPDAPQGHHVVAGSIRLDGAPIVPTRTYRVTINDFLWHGGDGFVTLQHGADPHEGPRDVDALEAYFRSFGTRSPPIATPNAGRIVVVHAAVHH